MFTSKHAYISCTDQSTTAPAWPRVSVSTNSGFMRTDKQPLEIPMNAAEEKKETSSEKLTALGGLCLLITVYWLSVVKPRPN